MTLRLGIVCLLTAGALLGGAYLWPGVFPSDIPAHPSIAVEQEIDLGECDCYSTLSASVVIRNRGREPLLLEGITTGCGCLGVYLASDTEKREKIESLEIPPQSEVTVIVQLVVTSRPGVPEVRRVRFQTNDPKNPVVEITIRATPTGRYFATVPEVSLGTLLVGEKVEQQFDITAPDRTLPPISRVVSPDKRIRAEYQPANSFPAGSAEAKNTTLIGRVRLTVAESTSPRLIDGEISIYADQEQPVLKVQVRGRVVPIVELSTREMMLPRASSAGPVFSATCVCKTGSSKTLTLRVSKAPKGVAVRCLDVPTNPSLKSIVVDAESLKDEGIRGNIELTAEVDGKTIPLTIALNVRPALPQSGGGK